LRPLAAAVVQDQADPRQPERSTDLTVSALPPAAAARSDPPAAACR